MKWIYFIQTLCLLLINILSPAQEYKLHCSDCTEIGKKNLIFTHLQQKELLNGNTEISEFFAGNSIAVYVLRKTAPHSRRYIALLENKSIRVLLDKKYISSKELKIELENFIERNKIRGKEKRQLKKKMKKFYTRLDFIKGIGGRL